MNKIKTLAAHADELECELLVSKKSQEEISPIKANTQPRTEKEFMEDHVYGEMMTMDIPYSDEFLKENE